MPWPMSQDYNEAIQDPATCFLDFDLKHGQAAVNAMGLPLPCSGNFADVYQVRCPDGRSWAVKCFTRHVPGLRDRYAEISRHLGTAALPFMVELKFLERGIRIQGQWYPALKMRWVEGLALNDFVRQQLDKPDVLLALAQIWAKMAAKLREARLAHGDLQHGNVLLVRDAKAGMLLLTLVDYDGMCVPALQGSKSGELGHPNYQHPQRLREGSWGLELDRFSHVVIYTALRALAVGGRPLWDRYDNGDNLLFKQADFESPGRSPLFAELLRMDDPEVHRLAMALIDAARLPMDRTPLLERVAQRNWKPTPLRAATATASMPAPPPVFAAEQAPPVWPHAPSLEQGPAAPATMADPPFAPSPTEPWGASNPARRTRLFPGVILAGLAILFCSVIVSLIVLGSVDKPEFPTRVAKGNPTGPLIPGTYITNSIGTKLAYIPAGKFMKEQIEEANPTNYIVTGHQEVEIPRPFFMGVYEVTEREYAGVMTSDPAQGLEPQAASGGDLPAGHVSWHHANAWCAKLSMLPEERRAGRVYRLPTEVEWEYAYRAGSSTSHYFDPRKASEYAWSGGLGAKLHPVGQLKPNSWGLYDMNGNAWEWCADRQEGGHIEAPGGWGRVLRGSSVGSPQDLGAACDQATR
jgi:formylglycine-generating enzyme required for sulfatase activity